MRRSDERILTTHTGSLPRPPELTRLYVRRTRGESIDPAELDRLGQGGAARDRRQADRRRHRHRQQWRAAARGLLSLCPPPHERVRRRLEALAARRCRALPAVEATHGGRCSPRREAVGNMEPPKAIGEVRYLDAAALEAECADFRAALDETGTLCRAVHDRAVARDHRRGDEERVLRQRRGLSRRGRRGRSRSNTRRSSGRVSCCSSIAPISRSNAT